MEHMDYFQNPQGSLFKLTGGEQDFILDMIREENPATTETSINLYTTNDFLDGVYMTEQRYEQLVGVLVYKKSACLLLLFYILAYLIVQNKAVEKYVGRKSHAGLPLLSPL